VAWRALKRQRHQPGKNIGSEHPRNGGVAAAAWPRNEISANRRKRHVFVAKKADENNVSIEA
jgi:hypothetical protein